MFLMLPHPANPSLCRGEAGPNFSLEDSTQGPSLEQYFERMVSRMFSRSKFRTLRQAFAEVQ